MLVYLQDSTLLLATNTFLNLYARRAHPYDFHTLRYLFAGTRKRCKEATATAWARQFGVRVLRVFMVRPSAVPSLPPTRRCVRSTARPAGLLPGIEFRLDAVPGVTRAEGCWCAGRT